MNGVFENESTEIITLYGWLITSYFVTYKQGVAGSSPASPTTSLVRTGWQSCTSIESCVRAVNRVGESNVRRHGGNVSDYHGRIDSTAKPAD